MLRTAAFTKSVVKSFGTKAGAVGLAFTYADVAAEALETGTVSAATTLDAAISTTLFIGGVAGGPSAPVFWVAGVLYGGARLVAGDWMDSKVNQFASWIEK